MKDGRLANVGRMALAALITALMTLTLAYGLSALLGGSQRELANRVDRNSAETAQLVRRFSEQRQQQTDEVLWVVCRIADRAGLAPPVCHRVQAP